jgi:hypothetical protein
MSVALILGNTFQFSAEPDVVLKDSTNIASSSATATNAALELPCGSGGKPSATKLAPLADGDNPTVMVADVRDRFDATGTAINDGGGDEASGLYNTSDAG